MTNIFNSEGDQVTSSQLAVKSEVEQSKLSNPVLELQSHSNRPDVFEAQR